MDGSTPPPRRDSSCLVSSTVEKESRAERVDLPEVVVVTPRKNVTKLIDAEQEMTKPGVKNTFIHYGSPLRTISVTTPPGTCPPNFRPRSTLDDDDPWDVRLGVCTPTPCKDSRMNTTPSTAGRSTLRGSAKPFVSSNLFNQLPPSLPGSAAPPPLPPAQTLASPQGPPSPPGHSPSQPPTGTVELRLSEFLPEASAGAQAAMSAAAAAAAAAGAASTAWGSFGAGMSATGGADQVSGDYWSWGVDANQQAMMQPMGGGAMTESSAQAYQTGYGMDPTAASASGFDVAAMQRYFGGGEDTSAFYGTDQHNGNFGGVCAAAPQQPQQQETSQQTPVAAPSANSMMEMAVAVNMAMAVVFAQQQQQQQQQQSSPAPQQQLQSNVEMLQRQLLGFGTPLQQPGMQSPHPQQQDLQPQQPPPQQPPQQLPQQPMPPSSPPQKQPQSPAPVQDSPPSSANKTTPAEDLAAEVEGTPDRRGSAARGRRRRGGHGRGKAQG